MITNIDINKLMPHPNNPRRDVGDLTELAESIRINGVMQNLTVVDNKDYEEDGIYTVIIGHRRMAAAKLAGLKELPCAIVEMTPQQQISTMLLENIQRSDLTPIEQANGFQMMMDFGETVDSLSKKTGFSESTVRRRIKLMELDQEKFYKSVKKGATLMDFAELEKIKNIEARNAVLKEFGTNNYDWKLKEAIDKEKRDKKLAEIIEVLKTFAKEEDSNQGGLVYVTSYTGTGNKNEKVEVPNDTDTAVYVFIKSRNSWGGITLYKKQETATEDSDEKKKNEEFRKRKNELEEITERAYKLRLNFIKDYTNAKEYMHQIIELAMYTLLHSWRVNKNAWVFLFGGEEETDVNKTLNKSYEKALLIAIYCTFEDGNEKYYSWQCKHDQNKDLDKLYDFLIKLGYQMSDEERALQDGTHELFIKE